MKKQYVKPKIFMESLKLTNSIAACNGTGLHQFSDATSCSYIDEFESPLFYSTASGCATIAPEGSSSNGYICYDIPNDTGSILFVNS
jgi:hypothetical protein